MSPARWFALAAVTGLVVGLVLVFSPLTVRGTITLGEPTIG